MTHVSVLYRAASSITKKFQLYTPFGYLDFLVFKVKSSLMNLKYISNFFFHQDCQHHLVFNEDC